MIIFEDVTQRVQNFRNRRLEEFKSQMLNSISHNLKTPLNGIMLLAQAGLLEEDFALKNEFFEEIQRNGTILLALIQQMLNQQALEGRRVCAERVDVRALLRDVGWLFESQLRLKNVTLSMQNSAELECVRNNDDLLRFVLIQLIENALKHARAPGRVRVTVEHEITDANLARLTVEDDGHGMTREIIAQISRPLEQQVETRAPRSYQRGLGYGLSICQQILRQIGPKDQQLAIHSSQAQGTSVSFLIYK